MTPRYFILAALLAIGGCTATVSRPPSNLLADCPEPAATFRTNAELADYALSMRHALRMCNNDKAALREWAKE